VRTRTREARSVPAVSHGWTDIGASPAATTTSRHWHIDYLLGHPETELDRIVRSDGVDAECAVADRLPTGPIGGFGASDCGCESHLATGSTLDGLASRVCDAHERARR